eukprot:PhF_6_TR15446/c0_g1_i1/m.23973
MNGTNGTSNVSNIVANVSSIVTSCMNGTSSSGEEPLPPNLAYHLRNAPSVYNFMWPIGFVAALLTTFVALPHVWKLQARGEQQRVAKQIIFMPRVFRYLQILSALPVFLVWFNVIVLFSPVAQYAMEFVIACFEVTAFAVYFALVVFCCGGPEKMTRNSVKTKVCMCVEVTMTPGSFNSMWLFVHQTLLMMPLMALGMMGQSFQRNFATVRALQMLSVASLIIGMIPLIAITKLAQQIAPPSIGIMQKFLVMKAIIIASKVPKAICLQLKPSIGGMDHEHYTTEVMMFGLGCFVSAVLLPFVAILGVRSFTVDSLGNELLDKDDSSYKELSTI